jgi:hypothetical protein
VLLKPAPNPSKVHVTGVEYRIIPDDCKAYIHN